MKRRLLEIGFHQSAIDVCLFIYQREGRGIALALLYVDDIVAAGDRATIREIKSQIPLRIGKYSEDNFNFGGQDVKTNADEFVVTMHPYEESLRLLLNEVRLGYNPDDEMTVRDIRRCRSILGRIAWYVYR